MREGVENLPAETDRFGLRYHGPVVEGVVTLPSGHTAGGIPAYVSTIAVSGKPGPYGQVDFDNAADVYLKNYAVLSFDETLYNTSIMGKSLGKEAVPFVAPSGRVWLLSADSFWNCSASSFSGTAKRFGLFGKGAVSNTHAVTIANPVASDPDLSSCTLRLTDATRDGSKRIYRADSGGIAIAWLELTLSEVSATVIAASLAVTRTVVQTRGAHTYQARTYSAPLDGYDVIQGATRTKTIDTPTHVRWEFSPAAPNNIATPTSTSVSVSDYFRVSGHIFGMLYDDSGALIESAMDIETVTAGTSSITTTPTASGSCVVDRTFNGSTWDETITGSVSVEVSGGRSSTVTSSAKMSLAHGGAPVGGVEYTVTATNSESFGFDETGGAGPLYSYQPSGPSLHISRGQESTSTTGFAFKSDGATVKTYSTSPVNLSQTDTRSGEPQARGGSGHGFPTTQLSPAVTGGAPPSSDALFAQMYVNATLVDQTLGQVTPTLFCRLRRRSNTVLSFPGAMVTGLVGSHVMESSWDSQLIGRNGILDPTKPAVVAAYGGGDVTWDLPTVSEQPVTGEWLRGATATQNVGFV